MGFAFERELLQMCGFWNGVCIRILCLVEGEHCRFQCGNVVEEAGFEKKGRVMRKGFGILVMVGACLAVCGGLGAAASMLG